jgi:DNA-binding beta-propeller fold protein YncE
MNGTSSDENAVPEQPWETRPASHGGGPNKRRRYGAAAALVLTVAILAALVAIWRLPGREGEVPPIPAPGEGRPLGMVSDLVFPTEVLWKASLDSASMPADVALVDNRIFVLDTNNNRVLEVDDGGKVLQTLDVKSDSRLDLKNPMAMAAHGDKLYVANSDDGNVIVLNTEGAVEGVITAEVEPAEHDLRPIGIAVGGDGSIYLSDPDNHRVLHLDKEGRQVSILGSGTRGSGEYDFNTPGGLFLDGPGNLYVVDMLNYSIKKYSPSGEFLFSVGEAGDTDGTFSRPKAVAVDAEGRIFVSDTLLVAVEVFDAEGTYLGFIGRENPDDKESGSMFMAPHGLTIVGDTLYAVDRFAGLFALRLQG